MSLDAKGDVQEGYLSSARVTLYPREPMPRTVTESCV